MFRFDIKVKDLAANADVKETQLSAFRTGKRDLYTGTLERIIGAMSPEAQIYYYELLRRSAESPERGIKKELAMNGNQAEHIVTPPEKLEC